MIGQIDRVIELQRMSRSGAAKKKPKIFSFASGKGGTGKTVLALNIAYSLSKQNKKVLLVDLDSNLSNVDIMLNIIAQKTLGDFYTSRRMLDDLITEYEPNLHIIFGDSGQVEYPLPKVELVNYFFRQIEKIEENYDYIFLDTAAGANDNLLKILTSSDFVVMVTNPEPTAVMDAYVVLKFLKSRGCKSEKHVIVNKTFEKEDGEITFNNLLTAAGHFLNEKVSFMGAVSFSSEITKSIMSQSLLLKTRPESKPSKQISRLSKKFIEIAHMANIRQGL